MRYLILALFLTGCASTQPKYYFECVKKDKFKFECEELEQISCPKHFGGERR